VPRFALRVQWHSLIHTSYGAIPKKDSPLLAPGVTPGICSVLLILRFDELRHGSMSVRVPVLIFVELFFVELQY
jgi:hypothetical protein